MKILFYGFQHGHIDGLYRLACETEEVEIAACLEDDEIARRNAELRLGISFDDDCYENWLLKDIDIVAIGGKYGQRGQAIIKALKAGKHVISDKPICTKQEELEEIEKITNKNCVKLACMLDLRYISSANRAREVFKSKRLGKVCNVSFTGQHCIDYDHRPLWYFEKGMHGGTVNDLAIHGIDLIRDLLGLEIVDVDGIRTWNSYATKHEDFKDCAVFMARLSNGAELLADVSYSAPTQVFSMPTYWNFKVWCEKGLVTFNLKNDDVIIYEEGIPEPQVLEGIASESNYLKDLISEIENNSCVGTQSVINSTRAALYVQKYADRMNNEGRLSGYGQEN